MCHSQNIGERGWSCPRYFGFVYAWQGIYGAHSPTTQFSEDLVWELLILLGLSRGLQLPARCHRHLWPKEGCWAHPPAVQEIPHVMSHSVEIGSAPRRCPRAISRTPVIISLQKAPLFQGAKRVLPLSMFTAIPSA